MADRPEEKGQIEVAEEADARRPHEADRPPTADEEEAAERAATESLSDDQAEVASHYLDMTQRGVQQQGEGRIS